MILILCTSLHITIIKTQQLSHHHFKINKFFIFIVYELAFQVSDLFFRWACVYDFSHFSHTEQNSGFQAITHWLFRGSHSSWNLGNLSPGTTTCSTPASVITTRWATPPLTLSLPMARARAVSREGRGGRQTGTIKRGNKLNKHRYAVYSTHTASNCKYWVTNKHLVAFKNIFHLSLSLNYKQKTSYKRDTCNTTDP